MILVDTGPLVATLVPTDVDHQRCVTFFDSYRGDLLISPYVAHEVSYLVERDMGPKVESAFIRSLARGELIQMELILEDLHRVAELIDTYADFPLGAADASVIALAERFGLSEIATLDHRHFRVVRPRHVESFRLLPEGE